MENHSQIPAIIEQPPACFVYEYWIEASEPIALCPPRMAGRDFVQETMVQWRNAAMGVPEHGDATD